MAEIVAPPSGSSELLAHLATSNGHRSSPALYWLLLCRSCSSRLERESAFLFFRRTRPIPTATPQRRWRLSGDLWFR